MALDQKIRKQPRKDLGGLLDETELIHLHNEVSTSEEGIFEAAWPQGKLDQEGAFTLNHFK
jgi:hypothetical protein